MGKTTGRHRAMLEKKLDVWFGECFPSGNNVAPAFWSRELEEEDGLALVDFVFDFVKFVVFDSNKGEVKDFIRVMFDRNLSFIVVDAVFSNIVTKIKIVVVSSDGKFSSTFFVQWVFEANVFNTSFDVNFAFSFWHSKTSPEFVDFGWENRFSGDLELSG